MSAGVYEASDRVMTSVPLPNVDCLPTSTVFTGGTINYKALFQHFMKEGKLEIEHVLKICRQCAEVLKKEPNLLLLKSPITVVGDIHGQFYDLQKLFDLGGDPVNTNYLFLGDYVDRGCFSTEVCLYLFALKIVYPTSFFFLRGNHECRQMTEFFNFRDECEYKYSTEVWEEFMTTFDCLPLAATIDSKFLCLHGGLSPEIETLDDINAIDRFREPPNVGAMCDLLWADPAEDAELFLSTEWTPNSVRGCSYIFGFKAVQPFLLRNRLYSVVRAHEAQLEGYRFYEYCQSTDFPSVVTIFSAPNYCDAYNNKGAILKFHNRIFNICQFKCAPHPYYLPNFMDVFSWSVPFVSEKVTEILSDMLNNEEDSDGESEDEEEMHRRNSITRVKVIAVVTFVGFLKTLRKEADTVAKLKRIVGKKLPVGLLAGGGKKLKAALQEYEDALSADRPNEMRPGSPRSLKSPVKLKSNVPIVKK